MNHENDESAEHQSDGRCHYQAQYDNRIFTCRVRCTKSFSQSLRLVFLSAIKEKKRGTFRPISGGTLSEGTEISLTGKFSVIVQLIIHS